MPRLGDVASMPAAALLSDIGNVLVSFDFRIAAERCAEFCPFPPEALFSRLDGIKQPYESGALDDDEFLAQAAAALKFSGTRARLAEIWCEIFQENTAMESTLAGLRGAVPLYLLSNTNGLHKEHLFRTCPVLRHFQGGVYSYSARCAKPERRIFEMAVDELSLEPARTLYVDDLEPNLETAAAMGFQTHLYHLDDHPAFERALADWKTREGLA